MKTSHLLYLGSCVDFISDMPSYSIDLIVTSPPYPHVAMWNYLGSVENLLANVFINIDRIILPGGKICVNIGDAVINTSDTLGNGNFQLIPNAARFTNMLLVNSNIIMLPSIIWSKPTNAPNKFLGSGMNPPNAYVTLEHEHILIFSRIGKHVTDSESAYTIEERNTWFSDIWRIPGEKQIVEGAPRRNAAFPIDIPYRLIRMFSCKNNVVFDPFAGTATTTIAAIIAGRNSIGVEIDPFFFNYSVKRIIETPYPNDIKVKIMRQEKDNILFEAET